MHVLSDGQREFRYGTPKPDGGLITYQCNYGPLAADFLRIFAWLPEEDPERTPRDEFLASVDRVDAYIRDHADLIARLYRATYGHCGKKLSANKQVVSIDGRKFFVRAGNGYCYLEAPDLPADKLYRPESIIDIRERDTITLDRDGVWADWITSDLVIRSSPIKLHYAEFLGEIRAFLLECTSDTIAHWLHMPESIRREFE